MYSDPGTLVVDLWPAQACAHSIAALKSEAESIKARTDFRVAIFPECLVIPKVEKMSRHACEWTHNEKNLRKPTLYISIQPIFSHYVCAHDGACTHHCSPVGVKGRLCGVCFLFLA